MNYNKKKIEEHEKTLKEEIFFTKSKWPHFDLLFEDIKKLSKKLSKNKTIVSLERNRLYGGISLFAPFFKQKFIAIDCYTEKLFKRGAYNKHLIKNNRIIKFYKDYIFEPLIRELHQEPEDYGRFTPYGLRNKLKKLGFKNFKIQLNGGPFTAAAYCWDQAIQYLPIKKRKKEINWLNKKISYYKSLDKKFSKNLVRKNTSFPVSFSILAQK